MSVCIYYHPEAYSTTGERLMGRNAAGESFLKGYLSYSKQEESLWIYNNNKEDVIYFSSLAKRYNRNERIIQVSNKRFGRLRDASILYYPGPDIAEQARRRRFFGDTGWSICGITHTTASSAATNGIIDLVSAPVREWDGLICPSTAVKGHVLNIISAQKEYMRNELGATQFSIPEMPVIPLGINMQEFVFSEHFKVKSRASLGLDDDTIVFLYVGRLSFHAKANPIQMYKALEFSSRKTKKNIVLIECGWFANDWIRDAFVEAAKKICPSVRVIHLDGRVSEERAKAWSAADIFCSLSDNIQETFGIVPLEGMAAGIPVVVSDWNGYKDTVSDGVEGFRIPSMALESGLQSDIAYRHALGIDTYDMYCGFSSTFVGLDIDALNDAFCKLVEDSSLRLKMGQAGRRKIEATYDWANIIKVYEDFWASLDEIRSGNAKNSKNQEKILPNYIDPSQAFRHYSSENLDLDTKLCLFSSDKEGAINLVQEYRKLALVNYVDELLPSDEAVSALIMASSDKPERVRNIINKMGDHPSIAVQRALAWLIKLGIYKF